MRFKELVEIYFKQYAPNNLKEVTSYNYQKDLRKLTPHNELFM